MKLNPKQYDQMVKKASPPSPVRKDCLWAFFVGGGICLMGEGMRNFYLMWYDKELAGTLTSITLVFLSAVTVLVLQGGIALLAGVAAPVLSTEVVNEMSAVGGTLFIGMAINLLGLRQEKIKVGDMLPAIFLPILYFPLAELVSGLF